MVFCVEVLYSFKVKQRVSCSLVALVVSLRHFFKVLSSPLGAVNCHEEVKNNAAKVQPEELYWEHVGNGSHHKDNLQHDWSNVEKSESQNLAKGNWALWHNPDDFACLSLEMECQTLVLHMSVNHCGNFHLSVGRHVCKWNFSDVIQKLGAKVNKRVNQDKHVGFVSSRTCGFSVGFLVACNVLDDLLEDEWVHHLSKSADE